MIRLNKMTDYAVVMLSHMAAEGGNVAGKDGGKVVTAAQLAQDSGVPLPSASKLMKQLNKAGILQSHRGAGGGYGLNRAARDITVAEIVVALEGPIALTACVEGADTSCDAMSWCAMSGRWNHVNRAIQVALEGVSLADMLPAPMAFRPASNDLISKIKTESQITDNKEKIAIGYLST